MEKLRLKIISLTLSASKLVECDHTRAVGSTEDIPGERAMDKELQHECVEHGTAGHFVLPRGGLRMTLREIGCVESHQIS